MSRASEYDRFGKLRRIQKREYERVTEDIAKKLSEPTQQRYPIFTDRTTMERKGDKKEVI